MSHEVETMAYAESVGTPWHGLGNRIRNGASVEEMIQAAGLDWMVHRRFVQVEALKDGKKAGKMLIPDQYAVMRDTDNQFYQFCGDKYRIVQNREMLNVFKAYADAGDMQISTAGALRDGAIVWAMADVNHGTDFTLAGGDTIKSKIVLVNSHDGSLVYQGFDTSIAVVCMNTLRMSIGAKDKTVLFKMKHSTSTENRRAIIEDVQKRLQAAIDNHKRLHETAQMLSETPIEGQELRHYVYQVVNDGETLLESAVKASEARNGGSLLDAAVANTEMARKLEKAKRVKDEDLGIVGRRVLEAIMNSPGCDMESRKGTMWGALNGVTYYTDHVAGRSRDTALQSAWFGDKANMKAGALELAVQYAEALQTAGRA